MNLVHLFLQGLWAAEQAAQNQQQPTEDSVLKDLMDISSAIRTAEQQGLPHVLLPCALPQKKILSEKELREFIEKEKEKNPDAEELDLCCVCTQSFFTERSVGGSFKKAVFKISTQLPKCIVCPNLKCSNGRSCYTCIRHWVREKAPSDPKTYSFQGVDISNERMVQCPYCRYPLNVELSELDEIPRSASMTDLEILNYYEDLVNSEEKPFWLLEMIERGNVAFAAECASLVSSVDECDDSHRLLVSSIAKQSNFYLACTDDSYAFNMRVDYIKNFIQNCTEEVSFEEVPYRFIENLKDKIARANLSLSDIEKYLIDICSVVPVEHAEKFSMIYHAMLMGYLETSRDSYANRLFITKWILSKYSFVLTGFKHCSQIRDSDDAASYFPYAIDFYIAFGEALFNPSLIDNIIDHNALEFTFRGLSFYPRECITSREWIITFLIDEYYEKLKEENGADSHGGYFVNRHNADVRRFSFKVYKKILVDTTGPIAAAAFNPCTPEVTQKKLPAFIYDAILKVLFSVPSGIAENIGEKITAFATFHSSIYHSEKNVADYQREAYKAHACGETVVKSGIEDYLENEDYPTAVLLFKNLPNSSATQAAIELFKSKDKLEHLLNGIQNFEFVNWENETPIYNMLKEINRADYVQTMLCSMSMQPSCFFNVESEYLDAVIEKIHINKNSYAGIGALAFVCRNTETLKKFENEIEQILMHWDFVQSFDKFYNGAMSAEGKQSISSLPFFRMYYKQIFSYLDKYLPGKFSLKTSRMLMVAKLALRDNHQINDNKDNDNNDDRNALGMEILKAAAATSYGPQVVTAMHFYLSESFRKHMEENVLPEIIAIEGEDSAELLKARELRGYYRRLLKFQGELDTRLDEAGCCSEAEMEKFKKVLKMLDMIDGKGGFNAIKKKSEIAGAKTEAKYYTDNIAVLPACVVNMILPYL
ncbi:hypothetical protein ENBRE01_2366 [Enteropsectra breve]|nr:hypothetical protein ENBRE01_2366 [Enteropsectra breve]